MAVWTISSKVSHIIHGGRSGAKTSGDTILHSWEVLATILQSEEAKGIVCDIGM